MSNHAKRRPREQRVITPKNIFPTTTQMTSLEYQLVKQLSKAKHKAEYRELGPNMGEVDCSCGFVIPTPFGEQQAVIQIEEHYSRFHVIPEVMGAKYRE